MIEYSQRALLPEGLQDELMPTAAAEARVIHALTARFESHGYDLVAPPLIEFEDSLLAGPGAARGDHMFRLMDPQGQATLALRSDITPQIARLAATRLAGAPRPLRLAYSGQVLRVRGNQLHPERQFTQTGAELIGVDTTAANVEVILLAVEALEALGVEGLSVDLIQPTLVPAICEAFGMDAEASRHVRAALDAKDVGALSGLGGDAEEVLGRLLAAAGPADNAFEVLKELNLPAAAAQKCTDLWDVCAQIRTAAPNLKVTVDPGEFRGFRYHTGVCFSFFASHGHRELGRGGRYLIDSAVNGDGGESATGFTIAIDSLLRVLPSKPAPRSVFVPFGTAADQGAKLRSDGWQTIAGLEPVSDDRAEAERLGCGHYLHDQEVVPSGGGSE